jgi:hypothetical protein
MGQNMADVISENMGKQAMGTQCEKNGTEQDSDIIIFFPKTESNNGKTMGN